MKDVVALVTGASRGVGRGIALSLLAEGATVHVTGRTRSEAEASLGGKRAGSLEGLALEAAALPGRLVVHHCDHSNDAETERVAEEIRAANRLDILVNNAWPGYENMVEDGDFTWPRPFWEQPVWRWDAMIGTALRAAFMMSRAVAPTMISTQRGLIVNISFWAAQFYDGNTIYGMAKAAADKMAADFAHELRPHKVAAVALYPGLVRTEAVMQNAEYFDLSNSESPRFIGHVIAGLWRDPALMSKSGRVLVAAELGREYDIADVDGYRPVPLSAADFVKS
ncbi:MULTISPECIES: SDR family NAD(P)-dependent oxidoreductase [unclassified Rhizobium]|uniref:SDR family NAD(P)-dependent oxidoreductase n=1 Tax=unclassified Rhizobium TaxID=2613769 RepID=UPI00104A83F1|nr:MULTISPECIES: SDR family NAD(P)-dependent oxidoreductase [unclassified Rhizobium]MBB3397322.1 NAD(P)-dependent dehydrogenase (short-subunit alcohol dehydrogenase family) [Rhizobium sp. BK060]MBB4171526.1 NAD(P)-dependent dehydrogenase (short-subunit alcohol dehydrogenase family) [Rhizobium sp. BK538]TCM71209.1 NAD(P)-dependent dehydrogenase (short-subunit alcohol dehydrogenase family) [Rhizobium sp. BK068]